MFSSIRKRFTYANVAMTLALVFAMTGGAYAAKHYLITSTKQIKPSVLAQLKGKAGAPGAQGAAGPAGPAGKDGTNGSNGEKGAAGTNGTNGTNGVSVTSAAASSSECKAGGVKLTSASGTSKVCNGEAGAQGPEGNIKATLPSGVTETGTWTVAQLPVVFFGQESALVPISFAVPLGSRLAVEHVHVIPATVIKQAAGTGELSSFSNIVTKVTTSSGEFTVGAEITGTDIPVGTTINQCLSAGIHANCSASITELELSAEATAAATGVSLAAGMPAGCSGNAEVPKATSGNLCIFESKPRFVAPGNVQSVFVFSPGPGTQEQMKEGVGLTGAILQLKAMTAHSIILQWGTWAVTG